MIARCIEAVAEGGLTIRATTTRIAASNLVAVVDGLKALLVAQHGVFEDVERDDDAVLADGLAAEARSDRTSHVVVMGAPARSLDASEFAGARTDLTKAAYDAFDDLSRRYDVVTARSGQLWRGFGGITLTSMLLLWLP